MIDHDELQLAVEEVRKAVAIQHSVLLGKDDPLLMLLTTHEVMLVRAIDKLNERNMEFVKAIGEAQKKGLAESKLTGSRVINEASDYIHEQAKKAVKAAFDEGIERLRVAEVKKKKDDLMPLWQKIVFGFLIFAGLWQVGTLIGSGIGAVLVKLGVGL